MEDFGAGLLFVSGFMECKRGSTLLAYVLLTVRSCSCTGSDKYAAKVRAGTETMVFPFTTV